MSIFKMLFFKKIEQVNIFDRDITDSKKIKEEPSVSYVKTQPSDGSAVQKIDNNIKKRYKKAVETTDIAKFHKEALSLVLDHLETGEFGKYKDFMKEIEYFLHYLFLMLQDDFFLGQKFFVKKMTKLDDYIFSQYRGSPDLEENIQKLIVLAYSNRFNDTPRDNLLSYFVFIEESGIELIALLEDFYNMLQKTQEHKTWLSFNSGKDKKIHKTYLKKEEFGSSNDMNSRTLSSGKTFYTVQPTFFENSKDVQIKIYKDVLSPVKTKIDKQ